MNTILLVAALACLAALGSVWWKVRKAHLLLLGLEPRVSREVDNVYAQLDALVGLYLELKLPGALPPTRGWAASPDFLRILVDVVRQHRPRSVLELGSGVSTVALARSLQQHGGGRVFSLDHDPRYAERTAAWLQQLGLSEYATVVCTPLRDVDVGFGSQLWYDVSQLPSGAFDLLVVDGPPVTTARLARIPAVFLLHERLSPGATIVLDDADRGAERETVASWLKALPNLSPTHVATEKGCVVLQRTA